MNELFNSHYNCKKQVENVCSQYVSAFEGALKD